MSAGIRSDPPLPRSGDVINFIFLFAHEAISRDEGVKERPCMVVEIDHTTKRVRVTPFTTKGDRYPNTMPVPEQVASAANLSHPTAIVIAETNTFTWLGYDVRPLSSTGNIHIGRLTPGFAKSALLAVLDQKRPKNVDRDTHQIPDE